MTIEDVVEELIQEEIEDESDHGRTLHHFDSIHYDRSRLREMGVVKCAAKLKQCLLRVRRRLALEKRFSAEEDDSEGGYLPRLSMPEFVTRKPSGHNYHPRRATHASPPRPYPVSNRQRLSRKNSDMDTRVSSSVSPEKQKTAVITPVAVALESTPLWTKIENHADEAGVVNRTSEIMATTVLS